MAAMLYAMAVSEKRRNGRALQWRTGRKRRRRAGPIAKQAGGETSMSRFHSQLSEIGCNQVPQTNPCAIGIST